MTMVNVKKFYAVRVGKQPGIYNSWDTARAQVDGYPNAKYKSFKTEAEAQAFMNGKILKRSSPLQMRSHQLVKVRPEIVVLLMVVRGTMEMSLVAR